MSSDEDTNVSRGRSRRSNVSSKQSKALEALREARLKGKKYRARIAEEDDDYIEVTEEEYAAERLRDRAFIEGAADEDFDEEDDLDDEELFERQSKKEKEKKAKKAKPVRGTITQSFQRLNKKSEPVVNVEDDPVLRECMGELAFAGDEALNDEENEAESEVLEAVEPPYFGFFQSNADNSKSHSNVAQKVEAEKPRTQKRPASPTNPFLAVDVKQMRLEIKAEIAEKKENNVEKPLIVEEKVTEQVADAWDVKDNSSLQVDYDEADEKEDVKEEKDVVRFYYLDAFEDAMRHPGTVYLFGRIKAVGTKNFESCCVMLKNISRQIFFRKRDTNVKTGEPVSENDLRNEVRDLLQREFSVTKYKSMIVTKKFLCRNFVDGCSESVALEVHFNANFGRIPSDVSGNTFDCVFNTTTTSMERIIVDQAIKGPCWVDICKAERVIDGVSRCQNEFVLDAEQCDLRKCIVPTPNAGKFAVPPIRLLALHVMTALNRVENEQQIVMISLVYDEKFAIDSQYLYTKNLNRFCLISRLGKQNVDLPFDLFAKLKQMRIDEFVKKAPEERSLLNMFLAKVSQLNPDLIVTHDWSSQLAVLVARMEKYQCRNWHLISRLKRSVPLSQVGRGKFAQWELTAGRLVLDSKSSAEELIRSRSYTMEDLVQQVLKSADPSIHRLDLDLEKITETFVSSSPKISFIDLIKWNWSEAYLSLRLVHQLNAIPLFLQITQIVGGVLSRTLLGGRAERNEFLLLHACKKNKIISPDKYFQMRGKSAKGLADQKVAAVTIASHLPKEMGEDGDEVVELAQVATQKTNAVHKKSQYTGGLVLEPKKGLYESFIVLLDFNSLYPSIIQEFNICFTTVPSAFADVNETDLPPMPGESKPDGMLKIEIRELVNRRREVKSLMKRVDPGSVLYKQYNIRQLGLKLTANSMYGCLGFAQSRFYAKTLAAMVTSKGREVLMHTKDLVQGEGFSVIYGDTDSIMVNTNSTDLEHAKGVAQKLKQTVNKNYRLLELDVDGIYKKLLLLKKKKYAGLAIDLNNESVVTREMKGLDIVRRDWSLIAKEIGDKVVDLILSAAERDEIVDDIRLLLISLRKNLDGNLIDRSKFEILKQLMRNPTDYRDPKSQPHVLVALRLNATKKYNFRQGDVIKYVICKDGTSNPATQRAYHLTELNEDNSLSIDNDYYLAQQVHPVVTRLCEPIEEIDAVQIAESLGIDPSAYRRAAAQSIASNEEDIQFGLEQDFDKCEGFTYECISCKKLNVIRSVANDEDKENLLALEKCIQCSTSFVKSQLGSVLKRLVILLREFVAKNAQSPFVCDDVTCSAECVLPGLEQWTNEGCVCFKCHQGIMRKVYSSKQLFDQQCFFQTIFDLDAFLASKVMRDKKHTVMAREGYDELANAYRRCLALVEYYLSLNDFNKVDLGVVFAPLISAKPSSSS